METLWALWEKMKEILNSLFSWNMNDSFYTAIWYSIELVLFMFPQRSSLVAFSYHTPAHRSAAHKTHQRALAELNKPKGASRIKHGHHAQSEVSSHRTGQVSATARAQGSKRLLGESGRGWLVSAHSDAIHRMPNFRSSEKNNGWNFRLGRVRRGRLGARGAWQNVSPPRHNGQAWGNVTSSIHNYPSTQQIVCKSLVRDSSRCCGRGVGEQHSAPSFKRSLVISDPPTLPSPVLYPRVPETSFAWVTAMPVLLQDG